MLIRSRRGWELPESAATPEQVFLNRRSLLKAAAAGPVIAAAGALGFPNLSVAAGTDDPSAGLYPVSRNARFTPDRAVTDEELGAVVN